jgi:type I restriction enzyme, S subunit
MSESVPDGWGISEIGEMGFDISDGNYSDKYPKSSDFISSGIPFIRANNIKNLSVVWDDMKYISHNQHDELKKGHLKQRDILITTRGEIGKVALVPDCFVDANINAQLVRINTKDIVDSRFLMNYLITNVAQDEIKSLETGTALKQLPVGKLKQVHIPLPPLPEQQKIASILTSLDTVIEKTEAQINKFKDLKQAMMQELLTKGISHTEFKDSPVGRIPKSWEVMLLKDVVKFSQGVQVDLELQIDKNTDGHIPFLRIENFTQNSKDIRYIPASLARNKTISRDDIVMVRYGASAGFVGHGMEGVLANNLFMVSPNRKILSKELLHLHLLDSYPKLQNMMAGGAMPALNFNMVGKIRVLLPPLSEQKKIVSLLSSIGNNIQQNQHKLKHTKSLKKALMQDLLTGKVRVAV